MTAFVAAGESVLDQLPQLTQTVLAFYLDLHRNPELSGSESRTAGQLATWLERDGYLVTTGVGGHGVVGLLRNGEGPTVMLRAELDALPIQERTGLPHASMAVVAGPQGHAVPVMHACGHDLHLAAVAGAATLLARATGRWRGTVMVVGQPAEETLRGARAMLRDGLFARFGRPDVVLAQHTAPIPAGMVAHGNGAMMAGSVSLDVVIHGRGGHASSPHLAIDPVIIAAAVVLRLQTIVSREFAPAEQVVLSVSSINAGAADNVLPDRATLGITARGFSDDVLDRVAAAVRRIVRAECDASGCIEEPAIEVTSRSPVNLPDPSATAAVRQAHEEVLGRHRVTAWHGTMSTEDFPLFADPGQATTAVPTVYWMLGCVGRRQWTAAMRASAGDRPAMIAPNHSPEFAPDVGQALPTGITAMVTAAMAHLDAGGPGPTPGAVLGR